MATKIIVKAKSERGRWRTGKHFTRLGVTLDTQTLTEEQLKAIKSDPELFVVPVVESEAERAQREAAERAAAERAAGKKAGK